ncbi:MAG: cell surface protein [Planctomycetia bacterium]|nr:cell surface protein [Planctomycetia bacterium]
MKIMISIVTFLMLASFAVAQEYKGPVAICPSSDGAVLYVLNRDSAEIAVVDVATAAVLRSFQLPVIPNDMALAPDGKTLYVGLGEYQGKVVAVNTEDGAIRAEVTTGHTPTGITVSADGTRVYACLRFDTKVAEYDAASLTELRRMAALHEPIDSVITPDGKWLYVANFLPHDHSDGADVAAEITAILLADGSSKNIRLPNGSSSMHGIAISPDGKYVYTTAILARYQLPTTQLERGWMNTNGFSIIDAQNAEFVNTVLLDDVDLGAANPWPICVSPDNKKVFVGLAGTHELCIVDIEKAMEKLASMPHSADLVQDGASTTSTKTVEGVPQDLAFLVGMKQRIRLKGKAPRSIAVIGDQVYLGMYFDDTIVAVNTSARRPKAKEFVALGPKPEMTAARRGELYWHDASLCFQHWQSCASCHPDARTDALNWDLLNDGIGNPKNAKSMLFSISSPPAMWHGVRATAEVAVRTGFKHILFSVRPEQDYLDIEEYIKAMKPLPSPYLVNGQLSESAQRGKVLFESERLNCIQCHCGEHYTDMKMHDVGSRASYDSLDSFDTPSLNELWRTSPYMHDGRFVTVPEIFTTGMHGDVLGDVAGLSEEEVQDLSNYILSL